MFDDKVVVITGAASGIGRALALSFANSGSQLALSDINELGLQETIRLLPENTHALPYIVNVADEHTVFQHAKDVYRDFGRIDIVINNAGATITGTVEQTSIEEYRWQLDINFYGVLYGTKAFLPIFRQQKQGTIVNISSVLGIFAYPTQSAYCISKFAVRALTESLWSELEGTGINAVLVHPAGIKSNIEKTARLAKQAGEAERAVIEKLDSQMTDSAEGAARQVLEGLIKGKRRILIGRLAPRASWMTRFFPNYYPELLKRFG